MARRGGTRWIVGDWKLSLKMDMDMDMEGGGEGAMDRSTDKDRGRIADGE